MFMAILAGKQLFEYGGRVSRKLNPTEQRILKYEGEEWRFWDLLQWDAVKWVSSTTVREEFRKLDWVGGVQ